MNIESKLDTQIKTVLAVADKHFKSKGYTVENSKVGSLHERFYIKGDITYSVAYWKKSKYTYSALIGVTRYVDFDGSEVFNAVDYNTKEEHYNQVEENLNKILNNIKGQN